MDINLTQEATSQRSPIPSESPEVSVIMLVYNHAEYLDRAIEGVISQQTNFNFELLIGEDHSTDSSLAVVARWRDLYPNIIRVITSTKNIGMMQNLRRLIVAKRGKYLAYCEGDDYWQDQKKLQIQVDFLRMHPEHGAVYTDYDHIIFRYGRWRRRSRKRSTGGVKSISEEIFKELLSGNFIQTCTLCVRSDIVDAFFCSELPNDEYPVGDWPQCLYIAGFSKIGYLDFPASVYRRAPGSVMNSGIQRHLEIAIGYQAMLSDFFSFFDVDKEQQVLALSSLHCTILSLSLFAGNKNAFYSSWHWLKENNPSSTKPMRRQIMSQVMKVNLARRTLVLFLRAYTWSSETWRYRQPVHS
ncbi:glycosyltransferase [Haliea salexigens]|uniref:glycosyltransferase n=1 Tax=Haliea salexigens TaxID=287487 RepID=UPI001F0A5F70|nr:glycosyltransferase [Haliea salexigens]